MLFNSAVFLVFFVLVYSAYLTCSKSYKLQNLLLLASSLTFYGWFNWRLLGLLAFTILVNYYVGRRLHSTTLERDRKRLVALAVVVNLTILGFFKYFNFFVDNFVLLINSLGLHASDITLKILLPVGISFYTFQAMGYVIDIYRRNLSPSRSLVDFSLFVSFFPQLVAGPVERATNLLPQITAPRRIRAEQIDAGIYLILWGFFKKIVIADNLALLIANPVFNGHESYHGIDLLLGILAFTVQIYCDFSGYTDIARGLCKLMGFELMVNFKLPYFALNPRDFWSRWHISLSSWLGDYLYIPLGGNRHGKLKTYRNLSLTMLLGGLWHGAAWNFVIWGAYHGLLLTVYRILGKDREDVKSPPSNRSHPRMLLKMLLMFTLTIIGWTIFRSSSVGQIVYMLTNIGPQLSEHSSGFIYDLLFFSLPLIIVQIYQHQTRDLLILTKLNLWVRIPLYSFLLIGIFVFGVRESVEFIYFQF
jgi:alginate O-acetyltransferase complex protein AlgI